LRRRSALRHTEDVPEFCTCGAELPPDARFCHKCAKPQRDEPLIAEVEPPPPPAAPLVPLVAGSIDFRNALAVRVGFMTALLASFFNVLLFIACPLWLGAAGFFCVYVYQRRTGEALTVRDGAKIGWITGLFSFIIIAMLFTLIVVSQVQSGEYLKHAKDNPVFHMTPEQVQQIFSNPVYLASSILFSLVILFVVFAMLPVAGGALGAKMLGKGRPAAIR
jgi:hypothetical protein